MSSSSTAWILPVMLVLAVIVATSLATAATVSVTPTATPKNQTIGKDELDYFTPYQGDRFDDFDWNLLRNLASHNKGNILISPISLKLALVLLYEGAQEVTARELAKTLHLPANIFAARDQYKNILKSLEVKKPEYTLNYGNRIYLDSSIVPRQAYTSTLEHYYHTKVVQSNFSESHPLALMINSFVNNVTDGHINNLIDDEAKLKDSMMVIVSALYFQGSWFKQPFYENQTKIDKFYLADKTTIDVPFMRTSSKFYLTYAEDLNSKILRIPYAGHKYAMYFVLPQSPGQLDFVLKKITPKILSGKIYSMQELPVDVIIPKFKFDFTSHLERNLRELGIRDIFEATATLTGIPRYKSTSRRLVVTDVIQKAGIELNERGTTAYAATKVELGNKMGDETFHATHPFLFYIEDESTGTITYMGIVNNPLEKSGISQPLPDLNLPSRLGVGEMSPGFGSNVDDYTATQNFFNIELLQELFASKPGNVLVGTSSIKAALMVLAEAAAGRTRQQIISSLRLPTDLAGIRQIAAQTITPFKDAKSGTELQSAIKLWGHKELSPDKNFTDALQKYYKSELEAVDFKDVGNTIKSVNAWVKKCTNGLIDSIVDEGSLSSETKMLLTTAVYFKGTWLNEFDKSATRARCFHVPVVGCRDVPMMESVASYKYAYVGNLRSQVVSIPYTGGRVAMLVVLPKSDDEDALDNLSRDLVFTPIPQILEQLRDSELLLQLPKFTVSNKIDVRANLEKLKIVDLFNKNSNLTTAFPINPVQVGAVLHNARIEVTEEGTVAAAVTGVSVIPLMGQTMTTFRADRPFAFFLLDLQTNNILFAGRYVQPTP